MIKQLHYFIAVAFFFISQTTVTGQTKNILLEEFSTAPCGFCPDGDVIAYGIIQQRPQVIWVTHHAGFGTDSMTATESVTIANAFTTFAPGGCINRGDYPIPVYTIAPYIAVSRQKWDSVIGAHISDPAIANVGITNTYNATSRMLNTAVGVTFSSVPVIGDFRINMYVVEDSVVGNGHGYDQKSYFNTTPGHPFYGKGDTIIGYVHHRVVRKVPGGAWGVGTVIPPTPVTGTKYSYTFSNVNIPAGWKENSIDIVAFVSYYDFDAKKRQVLNVSHKMMKDASLDAVEELSSSPSFNIYPNPASDQITVDYSNGANFSSLEITNIDGKLIKQFDAQPLQHEMNIADLPNGVYFCRLISNGLASGTVKLVVVR